MSNHLAPATVTAVLERRLNGLFTDLVGEGSVAVRVGRPETNGTAPTEPTVSIFLYRVTPNAALRNADLPTRRVDGTVTQRPQAALDLHYLFTFIGTDAASTYHPERLLGIVVSDLHSRPILTPAMVRDAIAALITQNPEHYLAESDLARQIEIVRLVPLSLDMEELSKLWSTFGDTKYALSVAYKASVILIEADVTPQQALPVRDRDIRVLSSQQPAITEVVSGEGEGEPIISSGTLKILGNHLVGEDGAVVKIGEIEEEVSRPAAKDTEITLAVPPGLRAGVNTVCVSHRVFLGRPAVEHACFESNVVPFVLSPEIDLPEPEGEDETFQIATGEALLVSFVPNVGRTQKVRLLLNEYKAPEARSPYAYRLEAPGDNGISGSATETTSIGFALTDVEPAKYVVRAQVDGAFSALGFEEDEISPDFGRYNTPLIEVVEGSP